jgi:hypothetical protein
MRGASGSGVVKLRWQTVYTASGRPSKITRRFGRYICGLEHCVTNITGLSNVQLRQQSATAGKQVDWAASKRRTSQCDRGDSRTDGQCDSVAKHASSRTERKPVVWKCSDDQATFDRSVRSIDRPFIVLAETKPILRRSTPATSGTASAAQIRRSTPATSGTASAAQSFPRQCKTREARSTASGVRGDGCRCWTAQRRRTDGVGGKPVTGIWQQLSVSRVHAVCVELALRVQPDASRFAGGAPSRSSCRASAVCRGCPRQSGR